MQRKFLEELGLEKDVIDKIMTENGSDINKAKEKAESERDNYKSQLETAQTALKDFDGVDVKDMQSKINTLQNDLSAKESEYQNKLSDMEFNSVLEAAVSESGARNAKAVKALLDLDALKSSKNRTDDIRKALETVKTDNDFLFTSDEPIRNPVKDTGGTPTNSDPMAAMRAAMGLSNSLK